jgi:erythromycin esterase
MGVSRKIYRLIVLKIIVAIPLIFFLSLCFGQTPIKNYVAAQTQQISTIDPLNDDYSDLLAIGDAIDEARIVMLGEQDHGDAPTFLAKTRLIKYLHERKGFNVLAFESDFFSTNYNWQLVKEAKLTLSDFVNGNITALWSRCTACNPLFKDYLPISLQTQMPLQITGFDNQMGTRYLLPILDSVLQELRIPITDLPQYKSETFPLLTTWYNYTKDSLTVDKIISTYSEIKKQLLKKFPVNNFWVQTVENLIQQNYQFRNWKQDYWKDMNTRDKQMAANLKWLVQTKYANEKIIVWAHNYHVSKYSGHYPEHFLNKALTMGTVFTDDSTLMRQTYIIGFCSYQGTAGRLFGKTYKLQKPKSGSFENWINSKYNYAFVNFRTYNIAHPTDKELFNMSGSIKGNGHHTSHQAEWNRIFDGVFFIRDMYPCER